MCVRITTLGVMLLIFQLKSVVLQLRILRLRMDQDLQRSLVWLGEAIALSLVS